ncbi:26S proteasome regulatory subunit RPN1 [Mycena sanguinolenta]|uniref:26S proteasome regulatory subunit RPN1 n=1 Tax=Mycena sanguinolenta TaxID=230812 RepID=A0A8H7DLZ6_9AGAR|nr:26S proteasome regulatory subunit RPN1 [Mycena sanguinolenta]
MSIWFVITGEGAQRPSGSACAGWRGTDGGIKWGVIPKRTVARQAAWALRVVQSREAASRSPTAVVEKRQMSLPFSDINTCHQVASRKQLSRDLTRQISLSFEPPRTPCLLPSRRCVPAVVSRRRHSRCHQTFRRRRSSPRSLLAVVFHLRPTTAEGGSGGKGATLCCLCPAFPCVTAKENKKDREDAKEGEGEELAEEDLQLRNELEMLAERLKEPNTELYWPALETLRTPIRTSTSSMTSVPKPLKFLRPLYPDLQTLYETWPASEDKSLFPDILSVLAMTYSDTQPRGTLRYHLFHEYVRHLAAELGDEYTFRETEADAPTPTPAPEAGKEEAPAMPQIIGTIEDLHALAKECAVFLIGHNVEPDAVDLLEEMEIIDEIAQLVDDNTFNRVCQYMIRCVNLLPPPDDISFLRTAHKIYVQHRKFPEALALAIRLAFLFACAQTSIEWLRTPSDNPDKEVDIEDEFREDPRECLNNTCTSVHFRDFGKELGVTDPRALRTSHTCSGPNTLANIDSACGNLTGTFVNAFVNAGFGNDKLMVGANEGNSWVYKNKEHGYATASLGLRDIDLDLSHVDKYTYSSEEYIKAGTLLTTGILNSGVRTEADVAKGLIGEYGDNKSVPLKMSAIMGLGLAYADSHREDLLQLLIPHVSDDVSMEIASLATLALGRSWRKRNGGDTGLDEKWARYMALGLGLLYLGLQDASDTTIETLKAIEHPISKTAQIVVEACAFAGMGNVLKVQAMLHHCDEHIDMKEKEADKEEKKDYAATAEGAKEEEAKPLMKPDDAFQSFTVIAVALIAMGEDVGAEMLLRQFHHLMHYGEPVIRKSVPLAIGLVSVSNPQLPILDTLSKYSHDNDLAVALNVIFAMGLVGVGTINARLAQMLRQLAGYYYKEPDCLFMVRIAQGLVHLGKGTIGLNPFFSDRSIMSRPAVTGLLATLTAFADAKHFVLDKYHWMLYFLVTAMFPSFLITLDEELNNKPVTVRVGQALDVVEQVGKPRIISRFQTHQTSVWLVTTERVELAMEEFIPSWKVS